MAAESRASIATTQVFEVYIKASPQAVWDAITSPEWTAKYGYQCPAEYELRPGGAYRVLATAGMREMGIPEVIIDGHVELAEPPRKLVQTFRFLFDMDPATTEAMLAEGFTRVTWEIEKVADGFTCLTVTHELEGAPITGAMVSSKFSEMGTGGWAWILSDMKTILETGHTM